MQIDLIRRDTLTEKVRKSPDTMSKLYVLQLISPTYSPAVDAVPVVRCKDCMYYAASKKSCGRVSADPYEQDSVEEMDFCSQGESISWQG